MIRHWSNDEESKAYFLSKHPNFKEDEVGVRYKARTKAEIRKATDEAMAEFIATSDNDFAKMMRALSRTGIMKY
jgi:hypothetical protein